MSRRASHGVNRLRVKERTYTKSRNKQPNGRAQLRPLDGNPPRTSCCWAPAITGRARSLAARRCHPDKADWASSDVGSLKCAIQSFVVVDESRSQDTSERIGKVVFRSYDCHGF